ncbi:hypothetical protein PS2_034652 [Malus domestica]|uniref:Uncharacterized protein n=1 Tax=Malus domestica TaxID=3750 RepID=A0A498JND0_MALDO|nr:hypothetical protein DVH24_007805 [Malus domestica]
MALSNVAQSDDENMEAKPISISSGTQQISGPRKSIVSFETNKSCAIQQVDLFVNVIHDILKGLDWLAV